MAMEKEALTNTIESDLARRNRNWDKVDGHLAESASKHITESGENENGSYIKFDDGTLICYKIYSGIDSSSPVDSLYQSDSIPWTFPHAFNNVNIAISGSSNAISGFLGNLSSLSITSVTFRVISSRTFTSRNARVLAIGRWK